MKSFTWSRLRRIHGGKHERVDAGHAEFTHGPHGDGARLLVCPCVKVCLVQMILRRKQEVKEVLAGGGEQGGPGCSLPRLSCSELLAGQDEERL